MEEVSIIGKKVVYDPQKGYSIIQCVASGVRFAKIKMDKFLEIAGKTENKEEIIRVVNFLLEECSVLRDSDPGVMAIALTSPFMTGTDFEGTKKRAQEVKNTIEVLEQIVADPKETGE